MTGVQTCALPISFAGSKTFSNLTYWSVTTDSASSGTLNNYALPSSSVLYFSNASSKTLTGIVAPSADGAVLHLFNTGGTLNINHQTTSTSANQIDTGTGVNIAISGAGGVTLLYLNGFWRVMTNASAANTY